MNVSQMSTEGQAGLMGCRLIMWQSVLFRAEEGFGFRQISEIACLQKVRAKPSDTGIIISLL